MHDCHQRKQKIKTPLSAAFQESSGGDCFSAFNLMFLMQAAGIGSWVR
jgi:hypothetical protein